MTFADGTPIAVGYYNFDADGKMILPTDEPTTPDTPAPDAKNGVVGSFFYLNDVKQLAYQLIEYEGNFYFINDGNAVAKNKRIYLTAKFVEGKTFANGDPITVGYYEFDAEGKMIVD